MDDDFFPTCLSEDDDVQFEDDPDPDDYAGDGERCGICMEVVVDRGVLDCCEHWFCFLCIDNWATITNLCPLCQNEFQSITCVPVYDTIGSSRDTDELGSRDDDEWSIEDNNNTLSFPSYYIDENAVVCLDGDECKLRRGLVYTSEDANMDTSIACNSCDLWYHAYCVGFDTDNPSESTWFCPRCTGEQPLKSNEMSTNNSDDQPHLDRTEEGSCMEPGVSRKVSVSIADSGETAIVVSMVTEQKWGESKENLSNLEAAVASGFVVGSLDGDPSISCVQQSSELPGVGRSLSKESSTRGMPNMDLCRKTKDKLNTSICYASHVDSGDDIVKQEGYEEVPIPISLKRKSRDCSTENIATTSGDEIKREFESVKGSSKRTRTDEPIERTPSVKSETCSLSVESASNLDLKADFKDQKLRRSVQKGDKTDNMSLNPDLDWKNLKKDVLSNLAHEDASEGGRESGRRVKKIMRRPTDGKDSSMLLQKLREEIREAVQNKSTEDVGELFNPKLLEAFRAVVAGPKPVRQNLSATALKMKRSFLEKGKVRENLTKKIYATSNGRRKRTWDRDCEIEFWKHRCFQTSKPEKVETLKSVLGLLRRSTEVPGTGKLIVPKNDASPILSRLYLADTSIFPRKDDIRPVVALHEAGTQHLSEERKTSVLSSSSKSLLSPLGGNLKAGGGSVKAHPPIVSGKSIDHSSILKGPNTQNGVCSTQLGSVDSQSSVSKPGSQKEVVGQSDMKSDKRRWALEVLARKTAKTGQTITSQEHPEDNTLLKGNYPLLAQLPVDMRPVPTFIRRNKIPMHVRQTQVYRLTEHLLKQANLPVIRRSAETELAVADAVNIEKGIAERSNSKLVYVNLCSQEVLRQLDGNITISENPANPELILPSFDFAEEHENDEAGSDSVVEEALKNAGLLSESPPGSPLVVKDVLSGVDGASKDERPKNVLEMNPHTGGISDGFDHENQQVVDANVIATYEVEEPKINMTLSPPSSVEAEKIENAADNELAQSTADLPVCPGIIKGKTEEKCLDSVIDLQREESHAPKILQDSASQETSTTGCEELVCLDTERQVRPLVVGSSTSEIAAEDGVTMPKDGVGDPMADSGKQSAGLTIGVLCESLVEACSGENSKPDETMKMEEKKHDFIKFLSNKASVLSQSSPEACSGETFKPDETIKLEEKKSDVSNSVSKKMGGLCQSSGEPSKPDETVRAEEKKSDICSSVSKKVEAFIKEHIRPLCKSGVITVEQYRWAVAKTTQKVMKYHSKDKNANFLIKEGEKVKKLALRYLEGSQKTDCA